MIKYRLAFIGYALVAFALLLAGARYSLATRVMPYHLDAMGTTWDGLSPGVQIMTLNFMNSVGAGFLTCAIALIFLLAFPFRKRERWANWAIAVVALAQTVQIALRTAIVLTTTPAQPPLLPILVMIGIAAISFALSLGAAPKPHGKNVPEAKH